MLPLRRLSAARLPTACLAGLALGGCSLFKSKPPGGPAAVAKIAGYTPNTVSGTVSCEPSGMQGLHIHGEIIGLLPGRTYAMHVHERGDCSAPNAAGPHFDPGGSGKHGKPGDPPNAHHAGDLPNITAGDDGRAKVDYTTSSLGIGAGDFSVMGRSAVIHANPDDYATQPAGNSGDRIACGVIQPR